MAVPILYPRFDHPAIEERYASWQTQLLLRRGGGQLFFYDAEERGCDAISGVDQDHVLVITDPLLLAAPDLGDRLLGALGGTGAFAALPSTNSTEVAAQRFAPAPYLTLRELELRIAEARGENAAAERLVWDGSDPGAFLAGTRALAALKSPMRDALRGREVVVSRTDVVHRWASMRGQVREDLLTRISPTAKAVLEFGCGEGLLGAALKQRQKCRVVGIELDREAAAAARKRIDDVYCGDANEIVGILHERFDFIVGGDIVEHLAEPWPFLGELRRIAAPDGQILLSLPNLANASVLADLLRGRFDYVYMGITCAGHLRFFTRSSIEDMLTIAGWEVVSIEPQQFGPTAEGDALIAQLDAAGLPVSRDDLAASGFYVLGRNRG